MSTETLPPIIARGPGGRRVVVAPAIVVEHEASGPITRRQGERVPDSLPRVPDMPSGIDLSRYRGAPRKEENPMPEPSVAPTERHRRFWNAYHEHGSQGAACRELGVTQGNLRSAILGYMRAKGIPEPIPPADRSLIDGESLSVVSGPVSGDDLADPVTNTEPTAPTAVPAPDAPGWAVMYEQGVTKADEGPESLSELDAASDRQVEPTPAETAGARLVVEQLLAKAQLEHATLLTQAGEVRIAMAWLREQLAELA